LSAARPYLNKKGVLDKLKIKQRQVMTVITNLLTAQMPPDEQ